MLAEHVHPSVVAMARTLLAGATIVYEGDPLRDLTLSAFLDKFVQKKPKVNRPLILCQTQTLCPGSTARRRNYQSL